MKMIKHGSIVGFDHKVWFRFVGVGGQKSMSLLKRARNDGCGQPCILIYDEETKMKNGKTKYKNARIRRFTPTECARLQTIPEWYKFRVIDKKGNDVPASDTAIYKALGNGWTIEVIKHIFSFLPESMKNNSQSNS